MNNILICGTNWVGDSVMSMPAIQALKQRDPAARITVLVKPHLADLWSMQPAVSGTLTLDASLRGTFSTAARLRATGFDAAFIFPNSFRSALIPFLARIPARSGAAGHAPRSAMLTCVRPPPGRQPGRAHQSWEYAEILGLTGLDALPVPTLSVPAAARAEAERLAGPLEGGPLAGLLPGAARGPAKRWPAEYFTEVGRRLAESDGCRIVVFGARVEAEVCSRVAADIGHGALCLAGKTRLPEFAALLRLCRVAVTNDSGGMHLAAAAVGTPVVAVFGLTDPARTGPLGTGHRIIADADARRARDIARNSPEAEARLRAIKPERVYEAVLEAL